VDAIPTEDNPAMQYILSPRLSWPSPHLRGILIGVGLLAGSSRRAAAAVDPWNHCGTNKERAYDQRCSCVLLLLPASPLNSTIAPKDVEVFNRSVSSLSDGPSRSSSERTRCDGVAYLRGVEFGNGTIEFDVRGKDVQD